MSGQSISCFLELVYRFVLDEIPALIQAAAARLLLIAAGALSLMLAGCGAVGTDPAPPASVTVTPTSAQPFPGTTVQFRASVQNAGGASVIWQVNQAPGGNATVGTIDSNGNYTAPATVPTPATVTVTAVLQGGSNASGSAQVTIQNLSAIRGPLTLAPLLASITPSQLLSMRITTQGVTAADVSWQVDGTPGGNAFVGTISAAGVYTPPASAGQHTIIAVLNANTASIGSAQVAVTDFAGNFTWRNDNARSGINSQERVLSPSSVSASTFGKLFSCPIDGYAYAQPLYVSNLQISGKGMHNVVIVATENNSVYAFDADQPQNSDTNSCEIFWQANLGHAAGAGGLLQTLNPPIGPLIGITGTPVFDPETLTVYVSSTIEIDPVAPLVVPTYSTYVSALDATGATTGLLKGPPTLISNPGFSAEVNNQRPALLLNEGALYVAFGSYAEAGNYRGWIFSLDAESLRQTGALTTAPLSTYGGGLWQSGGGPSADSSGNVFVATGDGPANLGKNYSDSVLRLSTTGGLSVADYFTPCDQWNSGPPPAPQSFSSAPLLLPDSVRSATGSPLLIAASKEGYLYALQETQLGGFDGLCPDSSTRMQSAQTGAPVVSTPIFWNDPAHGSAVFVAPSNSHLGSFAMTKGSLASVASANQSRETLGPLGATPVISSNGTSSAVLWLIDTGGLGTQNTAATLRAYDPNNLSNELYDSTIAGSRDQAGPAVKFTVPTVANGKVYVGTQTELDVYGLLN